ncbi:hypothetical protein GCM10009122_55540 [Fulvivirga kasyanovii]|uniref:DUF6443 domain-containing protein n=1 Tax=Fulvivirga kasyanovii TaxID=396812 RepID=A0ABW9RKZ5_9BACT|nr:DUF6443 domain-containing protein [Fulvivirga kasyanovii]MTI24034.1 hypothetical protein [Fulvivirga kasyanovii]
MKYIANILVAGLFFMAFDGHAQHNIDISNANYLVERNPDHPVQHAVYNTAPYAHRAITKVQYHDGLGRPIQTTLHNQSPGSQGKDLISIVKYDQFGRNEKNYLIYAKDLNGSYDHTALASLLAYYNSGGTKETNYPYAVTLFDGSPLNRAMEQGAPGEAWQPGGAAVSFAKGTNINDDAIKRWEVNSTGALSLEGTYASGALSKDITTDEEGHQTIQFINKLGQTILKRVQVVKVVSGTYQAEEWADTYYIYDLSGNLRYVLPPEAVKATGTPAATPYTVPDDLLKHWAFQYNYDGRKRMVEKRVPGSDWVYMVYDNRDRLVLTQDGNQRDPEETTGREWTFTKYDALNRPVATGTYIHVAAIDRDAMQLEVNNYYAGSPSDTWYESFNGSTALHGYTDRSFPADVAADSYLTVTYYDNYDFKTLPGFGDSYNYDPDQLGTASYQNVDYSFPATEFERVKGLATGSKIQVLDGANTWISTVTYYDDRYRVVQTIMENPDGNIDKTSTLYNFPGWVLATYTEHQKEGTVFGIKRRYTYDHTGRPMAGYHELFENGQSRGEVLLAENKYNELGELVEKNLHVEHGTPHQSIDYRYNIRGWLESVNNSTLQIEPGRNTDDANPDLFGMELFYNHPLNGVDTSN